MERTDLRTMIQRLYANDKTLTTPDLSQQPGQTSCLDSDYIIAIAKGLERNTQVTTLNLNGYDLNDEQFGYLARALYSNQTLKHLNLANTQITAKAFSEITALMFSNTGLVELNLDNTPAMRSPQGSKYSAFIAQALQLNRERAVEAKTRFAA